MDKITYSRHLIDFTKAAMQGLISNRNAFAMPPDELAKWALIRAQATIKLLTETIEDGE